MSLVIEKEIVGEVTSLKLIGDLDTNTAGKLEQAVKDLLMDKNLRLTMDCSALNYMSSYGLRVIVFTAKSMRTHKDRFVLHSLKPDVQTILKMGGFLNFMKTADDRDAAIAQLES